MMLRLFPNAEGVQGGHVQRHIIQPTPLLRLRHDKRAGLDYADTVDAGPHQGLVRRPLGPKAAPPLFQQLLAKVQHPVGL